MKMFTAILWGAALSLFITLQPAMAIEVDEIINKANLASYYAGQDGKAKVEMTITDGQGRQRTREFIILRRDQEDGGRQQFYVYFKKPSDVRKMAFLVDKHIDQDDNRWLYLPALDLVKRIAASDKRTSFVGSHFFYEDVSGRGVDEDNHLLKESKDGYFVIENTPKDPANVEFSAYTVWIDQNTFLPKKAEYLDKSGTKYRVVEALEVKEFQGIPTVVKSRVQDLQSGGETISVFSEIKYDQGLKESIFSERYLRKAPREVRR